MFASPKGWPASTTHSIIDGIVGRSITMGYMISSGDAALDLSQWDKIGTIALARVITLPAAALLASVAFVTLNARF